MKGLIKFKDDEKENPLIQRPDLMEKAFDHFARMSFNEASLSEILRNVGMNKGSFYFKFYNKMDLYLCLMERVAVGKVSYLAERMNNIHEPNDIFSQLRQIAIGSLEYAANEPRSFLLFRNYFSENEETKRYVKTAFPELNEDFLGKLVDNAIASGQLTSNYDRNFLYSVINLYLNNMDAFISPSMTNIEIIEQVDKVIDVLKDSIGVQ